MSGIRTGKDGTATVRALQLMIIRGVSQQVILASIRHL